MWRNVRFFRIRSDEESTPEASVEAPDPNLLALVQRPEYVPPVQIDVKNDVGIDCISDLSEQLFEKYK